MSRSSCPSLLGDPTERALRYLQRIDWIPFRGLLRGSALKKTSGLLLSDFDPFDSFGTEQRFMAELSLLGEFRFVEGPTYFKSWHGENLSIKREGWSREHWITANACLAAWMIEVIAPAGASVRERDRLFKITLVRFAGRRRDPLKWVRAVLKNESKAIAPLRMIRDQLKRSEKLTAALQAQPCWPDNCSTNERADLRRQVFERLKSGGRFDPRKCMDTSWEALEVLGNTGPLSDSRASEAHQKTKSPARDGAEFASWRLPIEAAPHPTTFPQSQLSPSCNASSKTDRRATLSETDSAPWRCARWRRPILFLRATEPSQLRRVGTMSLKEWNVRPSAQIREFGRLGVANELWLGAQWITLGMWQ